MYRVTIKCTTNQNYCKYSQHIYLIIIWTKSKYKNNRLLFRNSFFQSKLFYTINIVIINTKICILICLYKTPKRNISAL